MVFSSINSRIYRIEVCNFSDSINYLVTVFFCIPELPQLRSANSMELGCDARGFSRAGNFAETWYCAVVAGRPGLALNKMREVSSFVYRLNSLLISETLACLSNFL